MIAEEPDITQERIANLAKHLLQGRSKIRNIAAAPDLVIRYMYPREGNEAAIGLDYRTQTDQFGAVKRAYETSEFVLAGPVDLVQGGQGFIIRIPVFVDHTQKSGNEFWGVISAVIDVDKLYQASGLNNASQNIDIAIRGKDAFGEQGDFFYGEKTVFFASDPVLLDVTLPSGSWTLAAIPKEGWSQNWFEVLLFRAS